MAIHTLIDTHSTSSPHSFRHFYLGVYISFQIFVWLQISRSNSYAVVIHRPLVARSSHNPSRPIQCSSGGSRQWLVIHPFGDYIGDKVAIRAGCANSLLSEYNGITQPTQSVRFGCNLPIARSTIFSLYKGATTL